jgi:hypothetical protein
VNVAGEFNAPAPTKVGKPTSLIQNVKAQFARISTRADESFANRCFVVNRFDIVYKFGPIGIRIAKDVRSTNVAESKQWIPVQATVGKEKHITLSGRPQ